MLGFPSPPAPGWIPLLHSRFSALQIPLVPKIPWFSRRIRSLLARPPAGFGITPSDIICWNSCSGSGRKSLGIGKDFPALPSSRFPPCADFLGFPRGNSGKRSCHLEHSRFPGKEGIGNCCFSRECFGLGFPAGAPLPSGVQRNLGIMELSRLEKPRGLRAQPIPPPPLIRIPNPDGSEIPAGMGIPCPSWERNSRC